MTPSESELARERGRVVMYARNWERAHRAFESARVVSADLDASLEKAEQNLARAVRRLDELLARRPS